MWNDKAKNSYPCDEENHQTFPEILDRRLYTKRNIGKIFQVYFSSSKVLYLKHKIGLIKSLLFRCFSLCSDFIKLHQEIDKLKSINLYKNSYPRDLVDKCIALKNFYTKYWHQNL